MPTPPTVDRRRLLIGGSASAAAAVAVAHPRAASARRGTAPFRSDPFTLGVASGDPLPDGVVLWTRLAPDPRVPDGGVPPQP